MTRQFVFSSVSVGAGHPDKMADNISDAIVDAILSIDAKARVACEALVKTGMIVLAGEITSEAQIDYSQVARDTNSILDTTTTMRSALTVGVAPWFWPERQYKSWVFSAVSPKLWSGFGLPGKF